MSKSVKSLKSKEDELNDKKIELIYIGRISPEKGLLTFLTFFKSFPDHHRYHLNVLGDGPDTIKCKEYVVHNNLENEITFHGFVSAQTHFLIVADVLILPSYKEGLPMTLIEATSVGLTVIANDVGAISSLVKNQHNGILINQNNQENWHKALSDTLLNQKFWHENAMSEAMMIEEKYNSESWAKKSLELYDSLR